jgi:hypothetical protein
VTNPDRCRDADAIPTFVDWPTGGCPPGCKPYCHSIDRKHAEAAADDTRWLPVGSHAAPTRGPNPISGHVCLFGDAVARLDDAR